MYVDPVLSDVGPPNHLMHGSLTPPDKPNGDMVAMAATTNPLGLGTLASSMQTPPSPLPTPSPPMRHLAELEQARQSYEAVHSQWVVFTAAYFVIMNR